MYFGVVEALLYFSIHCLLASFFFGWLVGPCGALVYKTLQNLNYYYSLDFVLFSRTVYILKDLNTPDLFEFIWSAFLQKANGCMCVCIG